ncbi:ArsR family transcriptional regulator [Algoriphagus aestuariicola]|uniref:ArsR family transcriptional regulator n=1 Tax=Algoriphagus aestuariicola TaxID=1852016 RepID=A0ABS3BKR1_9BACT|nr:ArsR family transcriptional regulator [Algoriphagus aestuariicola]MBN7799885.1 ArsR family transcriptional regulator [Algoriphagus aestuariicola]
MLESLITSKTRLRLLIKFFVNSQNHSHLRGLADEFGESTNAIRKELNNLTDAGILVKHSDKNKIEYQANTHHPFYTNIRDIIRKYLGLDMLLEQILERMGDVDQVVLIGDIARGSDTGTIDVLVTGDSLNEDYFHHLTQRLEQLIDRKVIFNLASGRFSSDGLILFDRQAGV